MQLAALIEQYLLYKRYIYHAKRLDSHYGKRMDVLDDIWFQLTDRTQNIHGNDS